MERNKELVNPDWKRPDDWPYEEDWDSPAWEARMKKLEEKIKIRRENYGFITCPKCGTDHTGKTLTCRNCEFRALT